MVDAVSASSAPPPRATLAEELALLLDEPLALGRVAPWGEPLRVRLRSPGRPGAQGRRSRGSGPARCSGRRASLRSAQGAAVVRPRERRRGAVIRAVRRVLPGFFSRHPRHSCPLVPLKRSVSQKDRTENSQVVPQSSPGSAGVQVRYSQSRRSLAAVSPQSRRGVAEGTRLADLASSGALCGFRRFRGEGIRGASGRAFRLR